jgi:hypothetical protein
VELITSGGQLTGASWKLVKNGDPSQIVSAPEISSYGITDMEVSYFGWDGAGYVEGEVSGVIASPSSSGNFDYPADLKNVWLVDIRMRVGGAPVDIEYEWDHFVNKLPEAPKLELATTADASAAASAGGLTNVPASFKSATGAGVIFNTSLAEQNKLAKEDLVKTTAAIAVSEAVTAPGGALVVGDITLPYNTKSLGGEDVAPFSASNYTVLKYFENGGSVDLKSLGVVDFDIPNNEVRLNATLVIIDGAPGSEPGVTYPIDGNRNYGVKIVTGSGGKYLFVYDGVLDGIASDPIALSNQASGNGGSGGGGCDAGFGALGLLLLAGAVGFLRRKG